jgi:hypothetical protein
MDDLRVSARWRWLVANRIWITRGCYGFGQPHGDTKGDKALMDRMIRRGHVEVSEGGGMYRLTGLGRRALGLESIEEESAWPSPVAKP